MNPKYTLVNPLGTPIATYNTLESAFTAANEVSPGCDKFKDVKQEIREDGDVLLDTGLSIYLGSVKSN